MPHFITRSQASQMTAIFKSRKTTILDPAFHTADVLPTCETFDRSAIEALLAQPGCTQLRIYYGMDSSLSVHAIMVGVDENDDDLLPGGPDDENEQIVETARRCPFICPRVPL